MADLNQWLATKPFAGYNGKPPSLNTVKGIYDAAIESGRAHAVASNRQVAGTTGAGGAPRTAVGIPNVPDRAAPDVEVLVAVRAAADKTAKRCVTIMLLLSLFIVAVMWWPYCFAMSCAVCDVPSLSSSDERVRCALAEKPP